MVFESGGTSLVGGSIKSMAESNSGRSSRRTVKLFFAEDAGPNHDGYLMTTTTVEIHGERRECPASMQAAARCPSRCPLPERLSISGRVWIRCAANLKIEAPTRVTLGADNERKSDIEDDLAGDDTLRLLATLCLVFDLNLTTSDGKSTLHVYIDQSRDPLLSER